MKSVKALVGEKVWKVAIADLHQGDIILLETENGVRKIVLMEEPTVKYPQIDIEYCEREREAVVDNGITRKITVDRGSVISGNIAILPISISTYYRGEFMIEVPGYEIITRISEIRLIRAAS